MAQLDVPLFAQPPSSINTSYKLHIAVDFGTDGLGIAYAIGDKVFLHSKWNSEKYRDVIKPKTIILLDKDGKAEQFGLDAKEVYMKLASKKDHMLFERFKMALYDGYIQNADENKDNDEGVNDKKIDIKSNLMADNGTLYPSEAVFVEAFQYIQKECKRFLRKQKIKAKKHEIQWIITVPAIWSDKAKDKMRRWIIKAGLVEENDKNQCKIVYEPDCASLVIQREIGHINYNNEGIFGEDIDSKKEEVIDMDVSISFSKGEKYILIDAGGGTVDVACHEIFDEFGVTEILPPSGGPWGSCYIDDQYKTTLDQIFGEELMKEFKIKHANLYMQTIYNFQRAKKDFNEQQQHNCRLPCDFIAFLEDKFEDDEDFDVEEMVKNSIMGQSNLVTLDDETLEINKIVWHSMFDAVIDPLIQHIKTLLNEPKLMRNCKYLCLVGGLSCSPYFTSKIGLQFGEKSRYKLKLIIPQRPILSVVEGAAYFGITENYIKARRLRGSYGINMSFAPWKARSIGISEQYIQRKTNNSDRVEDCFEIVARKNDLIHLNQIQEFTVYCLSKTSAVTILYSNKEDPKVLEDGEVLATINIDNGPYWKGTKAIIEFHFYDTLLKVYAYPSNKKDNKQSVNIVYQQ